MVFSVGSSANFSLDSSDESVEAAGKVKLVEKSFSIIRESIL